MKESRKETIESLEKKVSNLQEKIHYMENREKERSFQEKLSLEKKARRQSRKRLLSRDAATFPEYRKALELIDSSFSYKSEYTRARDKVCLLFLYISGLKVSNLLHLRRTDLQSLLTGNEFTIPLIKKKETQYLRWPLTNTTKALASQLSEEISLLCKNKNLNDVVTTAEGKSIPLQRTLLDSRLNRVLKWVSQAFKKNISTHSFRIGQTKALIKVSGVSNAQNLIGHRDIKTTAVYSGNNVTEKKARAILEKAEKTKQHQIPRIYKKKTRND